MRISIKDKKDQTVFGMEVNLEDPPTVIKPEGRDVVSLQWDQGLDDNRHLRKCPVCGCPDLYARRAFPQVTVFTVLLAAAVIGMVLFGFGLWQWALLALTVLVIADVVIFFFSSRNLNCYRCHAQFRDLPLRRGIHGWDASVAEKYKDESERDWTQGGSA